MSTLIVLSSMFIPYPAAPAPLISISPLPIISIPLIVFKFKFPFPVMSWPPIVFILFPETNPKSAIELRDVI